MTIVSKGRKHFSRAGTSDNTRWRARGARSTDSREEEKRNGEGRKRRGDGEGKETLDIPATLETRNRWELDFRVIVLSVENHSGIG